MILQVCDQRDSQHPSVALLEYCLLNPQDSNPEFLGYIYLETQMTERFANERSIHAMESYQLESKNVLVKFK